MDNRARILRTVAYGILVLATFGCGPAEEKLVAVKGTVSLEGKPLSTGSIGFLPDASKGNERGQSSVGQILPDGSFQLATAGKAGVPLGWYKVLVWATDDPNAGSPWGPDGQPRKIAWLTHSKYTGVETSDIAVEVIEAPEPGRYTFNLSP